MATYIILSRVSPEALTSPSDFKSIAEDVSIRMKADCPEVVWKDSYATFGRFDIVDIVEANNLAEVEKAALIIRSYGHSVTETLAATPWKEFLANL